MKTLKRAFENIFTKSATSETEKVYRDMYRAWINEREKAAQYGQHHVDEIDAIFHRNF